MWKRRKVPWPRGSSAFQHTHVEMVWGWAGDSSPGEWWGWNRTGKRMARPVGSIYKRSKEEKTRHRVLRTLFFLQLRTHSPSLFPIGKIAEFIPKCLAQKCIVQRLIQNAILVVVIADSNGECIIIVYWSVRCIYSRSSGWIWYVIAAAKAIFNQLSIAAQQIKLANELHVMGEVWMIDKLGASIVRKAPAAHKHWWCVHVHYSLASGALMTN